jgi:hypothetical protein
MALGLAAASVFYPTASRLDTLWSGLARVWTPALVGAYELSSRRALSEAATAAPEESTATSRRGY